MDQIPSRLRIICRSARKSTQDKANKSVFKVTEEESAKDPPRKKFTCKICVKKHARFKRSYLCKQPREPTP